MDRIKLTSRYFGTEISFRITSKNYNKLLRSDEEDRMPYIQTELDRARYNLSTMFTRAQLNRANEKLSEGDYYNQVSL